MQTLRKLLGSGPLVKGPRLSARITPRHAAELGNGIQKDADEKIWRADILYCHHQPAELCNQEDSHMVIVA